MKRVYYFTSEKYAKINLRKGRLKVSRFNELNDPFELLAADLLDIRHREAFTKFKKQVNEIGGIICFSQNWNSPLLWGHYADKHSGIALGFDVPGKLITKVSYTNIRPKVQFDEVNRIVVNGASVLDKLIKSKFKEWKYEKEFRMFLKLEDTVHESGLHFCDFSPKLELREIILGINCKTPIEEIRKIVRNDKNKVKVMKAGMALRTFKIIEDRNYREVKK
jgi:hypothetical protein